MNHEPQASYPHPLLMMWRVLLTLPMAICWILIYVLLLIGWGLKVADSMLVAWNKWASEWE